MKKTKKTTQKKSKVTKSAPKKSSVKVEVKKQAVKKEKVVSSVVDSAVTPPKSLWQTGFPYVVAFLVIVAVLLYMMRPMYMVATVNGQPIFRHELMMEMEKQSGKQTLEGLVTKKLIFQKAKEQKVTVSDEEIDQEFAKIEESLAAQGQKLEDVLALQNLVREDVVEQIKIQKLVEKMVSSDGESVSEVSEEEIDTYLEQNKDLLPEDTDENEIRESLRQQMSQQKLSTSIQTWLQEVQAEAEVVHLLFAPAVEQE